MAGWRCPYCDQIATSTAITTTKGQFNILKGTKYGNLGFTSSMILCPNDECNEVVITARLAEVEAIGGYYVEKETLEEWNLKPAASVRVFPDYIPKVILEDYKEAALIRTLSPKASATLSRRCLQGMIRDFWGVSLRTLAAEINAIRDKVDGPTWDAIDAIRQIGNIGAHMEADIDVIVNVEPEEAELLIKLIEILIKDWYMVREEKRMRLSQVTTLALEKKIARERPQQ